MSAYGLPLTSASFYACCQKLAPYKMETITVFLGQKAKNIFCSGEGDQSSSDEPVLKISVSAMCSLGNGLFPIR